MLELMCENDGSDCAECWHYMGRPCNKETSMRFILGISLR